MTTVLVNDIVHLPVMTDEGGISTVTYCGETISEDDKAVKRAVTCDSCHSFLKDWIRLMGGAK
jgi:hypothetical protein